MTAKLLLEFAEIAIAIFDSEASSKYTALLFVWHFHVLMMMMTFRGLQWLADRLVQLFRI